MAKHLTDFNDLEPDVTLEVGPSLSPEDQVVDGYQQARLGAEHYIVIDHFQIRVLTIVDYTTGSCLLNLGFQYSQGVSALDYFESVVRRRLNHAIAQDYMLSHHSNVGDKC